MKKFMILMMAVLMLTGCEGDKGPTGPAGADGNANVLTGTISPTNEEWLWNSLYRLETSPGSSTGYFSRYVDIPVPEITADIMATGAVLVFFQPYPSEGVWSPLPYYFNSGYAGFSYCYVYQAMEGNIRLHHFYMPNDTNPTIPDLSAAVIPTFPFKYMIIGGEALQTADDKGIDLANHDDIVEKLIMQR